MDPSIQNFLPARHEQTLQAGTGKRSRSRSSNANSPVSDGNAVGHAKAVRARANQMALVACAALLMLRSATASAAWKEGFESSTSSWREAKADVAHRVVEHKRVTGTQHGGQIAEYVQIDAADGTYVYFAHDIPPARIVAELLPSVW